MFLVDSDEPTGPLAGDPCACPGGIVRLRAPTLIPAHYLGSFVGRQLNILGSFD